MTTQMPAEARRKQLLERIRQHGFAALPELVESLGVSESTIRRDLDALEQSGAARRTHGGVVYTGPSPQLRHFELRQSAQWAEKRAIAGVASAMIGDGETILLDGGSTTYELARLLVNRSLQVVTNSLPVASAFTASSEIDLVVIGGYVHARTGVCIGPYADAMLAGLHVRRAVLSVAGVNEAGFYNSNLLLVETERAMMRVAEEVVIVVDSSKFGHSSLARLCGLEDVDTVVVDAGLATDWRGRLEQSGVQLVVAPVHPES